MIIKTAFPAIVTPRSKVLILGSMPGEISLAQQAYYAHPRNAFWWIMEQLTGAETAWPYARRVAHLRASGVALWDVLHRCRRQGSLDSAIEADSVEPNDFAAFLRRYPAIEAICFNGKSVETLFRRHVMRGMGFVPALPLHTLPSTSPANARLKREDKLHAWRVLAQFL